MGRSRRDTKSESLELLLDTICNTFGGIVLIALLVCIMLQTSSKSKSEDQSVPKEVTAELVKEEIEREELTRELNKLVEATKQIKKRFGELKDKSVFELSELLQKLKEGIARSLVEKSDIEGKINSNQQAINSEIEKTTSITEEVEITKRKKKELDQKVAKLFQKKASEISIPKVQETSKRFVAFSLRHGKLYGPSVTPSGKQNTGEYRFVKEGSKTFVIEREESGFTIPDEGGDFSEVAALFSKYKSRNDGIRIWVWQNSFGRYGVLEKVLGELKYVRSIKLVEDDVNLFLSSEAIVDYGQGD